MDLARTDLPAVSGGAGKSRDLPCNTSEKLGDLGESTFSTGDRARLLEELWTLARFRVKTCGCCVNSIDL